MDFDQISGSEKFDDLRPATQQQAFQFPLSNIAQSDPNYLGWWSFEHYAVEEVSIPSENGRILVSSVIPNLAVRHLLAKI